MAEKLKIIWKDSLPEEQFCTIFANPLDSNQTLTLAGFETDAGLALCRILCHENKTPLPKHCKSEPSLLSAEKEQVLAFLSGENVEWNLTLAIATSPFRKQCLEAMLRIPYGETISYTELATHAGNARATRAAASACATNPIPLIIPCHRVLRQDSSLGGFGWGLDSKRRLLENETPHHISR